MDTYLKNIKNLNWIEYTVFTLIGMDCKSYNLETDNTTDTLNKINKMMSYYFFGHKSFIRIVRNDPQSSNDLKSTIELLHNNYLSLDLKYLKNVLKKISRSDIRKKLVEDSFFDEWTIKNEGEYKTNPLKKYLKEHHPTIYEQKYGNNKNSYYVDYYSYNYDGHLNNMHSRFYEKTVRVIKPLFTQNNIFYTIFQDNDDNKKQIELDKLIKCPNKSKILREIWCVLNCENIIEYLVKYSEEYRNLILRTIVMDSLVSGNHPSNSIEFFDAYIDYLTLSSNFYNGFFDYCNPESYYPNHDYPSYRWYYVN